jgi:hypothetical protein
MTTGQAACRASGGACDAKTRKETEGQTAGAADAEGCGKEPVVYSPACRGSHVLTVRNGVCSAHTLEIV